MLGELSEADDAVQVSWLHLSRVDTSGIENLGGGRPFAVMGFTIRRDKIVEIDILADGARLRQLEAAALDD
jgi:hypothetical protein